MSVADKGHVAGDSVRGMWRADDVADVSRLTGRLNKIIFPRNKLE